MMETREEKNEEKEILGLHLPYLYSRGQRDIPRRNSRERDERDREAKLRI